MAGAIPFPMEERTWAGAGMQFSAGHWPTYSVTSHIRMMSGARGKADVSIALRLGPLLTTQLGLDRLLTHLRGRSQKSAAADVSRFTSTPHVWSHRQVGHFNVGEKNAYPLSCPRHIRDHLRNRRNPGRSCVTPVQLANIGIACKATTLLARAIVNSPATRNVRLLHRAARPPARLILISRRPILISRTPLSRQFLQGRVVADAECVMSKIRWLGPLCICVSAKSIR